ncbi:polyprenyl synthetase family protein [Sorangium sp. So ce119]|uniref:polyprenyl synthetase family protein n=1 Tax=Sorangium sp. So ce119 TaxID=3133279 RepID=UPI003F63B775
MEYLGECRELALAEIERFIPRRQPRDIPFYDLMRDYPLRRAKALRPALAVATCRALGGSMEAVLPTAAALELYHNAFLIHDDVEDGSLRRRDEPTLHVKHGVPIAVNIGDGMLALALGPLLDNTRLLGLGKALRVLRLVSRMARESAEGQAMELAWVRGARWDLRDADYLRMVHKKTSYYSFITPMLAGGIAAGAPEEVLRRLFVLAARLGSAFQIQDDVLNLAAEPQAYGKEIGGDLWEGKHTLILLHLLRSATPEERAEIHVILRKERPRSAEVDAAARAFADLLAGMEAGGRLAPDARLEIERARAAVDGGERAIRTSTDVTRLFQLLRDHASLSHARAIAVRRARAAGRTLDSLAHRIGPSVHRAVLRALIDFVTERDW